MTNMYSPLSAEVTAGTSSGTSVTVSSAKIVRAVNASTTPHLVTLIDDTDAVVGSMTLAANESVVIPKVKNHKLFAANAAVKFTKITQPKG
jgi:diaminopimelate epimerase